MMELMKMMSLKRMKKKKKKKKKKKEVVMMMMMTSSRCGMRGDVTNISPSHFLVISMRCVMKEGWRR